MIPFRYGTLLENYRRLLGESDEEDFAEAPGKVHFKFGNTEGWVYPDQIGDRVPSLDGTIMYRTVEIKNNEPRSLFHTTPVAGSEKRSKSLGLGTWVNADIKLRSNPGTSKYKFVVGFHVLRTIEEAIKYRTENFTSAVSKTAYRVAKVQVGEIRKKPRSRAEVYLTDRQKILKIYTNEEIQELLS